MTQFLAVFRYSRKAVDLVWQTSVPLTLALAALTIVSGLLPAATAYVGQLIVDTVLAASDGRASTRAVLGYVAVEGGLVATMAAASRGIGVCESLLRAQLGQRVNVMILTKAVSLSLAQFEDAEFYDKLTRARREASARPLSLVRRTFSLAQSAIALISLSGLLWQFSPWAVGVLLLAGLPAFAVEAKFSGDAFRLFRWRSPESRKQTYLETLLAREDYAKEVKVYDLGPEFLRRYEAIFTELFSEDRKLTLKRGAWGFALGLLGTTAFYAVYAWIGLATVAGTMTLGQMTMYLLVFKQGQGAVSGGLSAVGGMYEDNLYLSNLYEYLEQPVERPGGEAVEGPSPGDGIRFVGVHFRYPGATADAVEGIDLHLRPGTSTALVGANGSGKTTVIKLLTGLYAPTRGEILFDGLPFSQWQPEALRRRVGVIFQDFARYQLLVGENIGVGDVRRIHDREGWRRAAEHGTAAEFIEGLPEGYRTQLGRWFKDGRELSGGQWQKVALSRAFMRSEADVLVLDEPTAAMDAQAEAEAFEHVRRTAHGKIVVLVSHRFSSVRAADSIVVLRGGRIVESGTHEELVARDGPYARLFTLQASGYQL